MTQHASDGEIDSLRPLQDASPSTSRAEREREQEEQERKAASEAYQALRRRFDENRKMVWEEYLAPYRGQWVAWWPDGSRIVDADVSIHDLRPRLLATGRPVSFYMLELLHRDPNAPIDPYVALCMRFAENRNNFPGEHLLAYGGQWVAWWPDGSRIVDADDDFDALWGRLHDGGYNVYELKLEHLPFPGESFV